MGLRRRAALIFGTALLAGCSSGSPGERRLTLHVDGPVARVSRAGCIFVLRAEVRGGGTQRTCLTSIDGFPAPNAVMHSRGLMTFAIPRGVVTFRVRVRQRFAADGAHARQAVTGAIVRGRGEFARSRGSISGGGRVVDRRTGIAIRDLVYHLTYRR